ncbi:unnamed protein product [Microthlaspi erraticum]|uniref:Uncharacterized protein n=1 Tax=Microthlaspi erraticum TaxID=1685480 RepID=A0A6D2K972_9BRAS|nr:unnamed protein product [Microthlaspi erraticum]
MRKYFIHQTGPELHDLRSSLCIHPISQQSNTNDCGKDLSQSHIRLLQSQGYSHYRLPLGRPSRDFTVDAWSLPYHAKALVIIKANIDTEHGLTEPLRVDRPTDFPRFLRDITFVLKTGPQPAERTRPDRKIGFARPSPGPTRTYALANPGGNGPWSTQIITSRPTPTADHNHSTVDPSSANKKPSYAVWTILGPFHLN